MIPLSPSVTVTTEGAELMNGGTATVFARVEAEAQKYKSLIITPRVTSTREEMVMVGWSVVSLLNSAEQLPPLCDH